jgi:hypothetical protein
MKFLFIFVLVVFSFFSNLTSAFATSACSTFGPNGSTPGSPISISDLSVNGNKCMTTPDEYNVSIYEIGICQNITSLDGSSNPLNLISTNCSKLFNSPSPIDVNITSSLATQNLSGGTFYNPPPGTYNYSYSKIKNIVSTKTIKYFRVPSAGNTLIGSNDLIAYTPPSELLIGACWTVNSTYYKSIEIDSSVQDTKCGATPDSSYDYAKLIVDSFTCVGESPYFSNCGSGLGNNNASMYLTIGGQYFTTLQTGSTVDPQAIIFYPIAGNLNISNDNKSPEIVILFELTDSNKIKGANSGAGTLVNYKLQSFNVHITAQ